MKIFLPMLLLISSIAHAQYTIGSRSFNSVYPIPTVQVSSSVSGVSESTGTTFIFQKNVAIGNTILWTFYIPTGTSSYITSITDDNSQTYVSGPSINSTNGRLQTFYVLSSAYAMTTSNHITLTTSGTIPAYYLSWSDTTIVGLNSFGNYNISCNSSGTSYTDSLSAASTYSSLLSFSYTYGPIGLSQSTLSSSNSITVEQFVSMDSTSNPWPSTLVYFEPSMGTSSSVTVTFQPAPSSPPYCYYTTELRSH